MQQAETDRWLDNSHNMCTDTVWLGSRQPITLQERCSNIAQTQPTSHNTSHCTHNQPETNQHTHTLDQLNNDSLHECGEVACEARLLDWLLSLDDLTSGAVDGHPLTLLENNTVLFLEGSCVLIVWWWL